MDLFDKVLILDPQRHVYLGNYCSCPELPKDLFTEKCVLVILSEMLEKNLTEAVMKAKLKPVGSVFRCNSLMLALSGVTEELSQSYPLCMK